MADRPAYPAHRESDVVLRDGSTVRVRPVRPGDEAAVTAFLQGLSDEARTMRFFGPTTEDALAAYARQAVDVDYVRRFSLVAAAGASERTIGLASYSATGSDRAEVSFAIADEYRGRGLGTILLGHLAEIAAGHGIVAFEAFVLPHNRRMVEVFRDAGFPTAIHFTGFELTVTFPTSLSEETLLRFDRRDQIAAVNALRAFFAPRGVAVIGASRRRGTIGGELFHNLRSYGFAGPVHPVNPAAAAVEGAPAYPTVEDVPDPVDLAVVAVPAARVSAVAEQCARKGVRAMIVISAGFAETGEEGRVLQAALLQVCRTAGMRLIGPNCMGLVNTDPVVRLNATFAPRTPPAGPVGFLSQSGALGLAIIEYAASLGLGLSSFVSVGNKADVSGNDLLNYWEADPRTSVILLYLESVGNPRRFARIARRIGRTKPIAVVKAGRSLAGERAASSHTGALVSASDATIDALFRQTGVIRTGTLEELFDVAALLAHQPAPRGRRAGIVTNGGGPAILCADRCEAEGLEVAALAEDTRRRLRACLLPQASVQNPVDLVASASAAHYREAVRLVAADPNVDALIVIFVPPLVTEADDVARAILDGSRDVRNSKPVVTVFMSARGVPELLKSADAHLPSYAFPESAAVALARAARYGEWRRQPAGVFPKFEDIDRAGAANLAASVLRRGGGWATADETWRLLSGYGIPMTVQSTASNPGEAECAAAAIGGEVALKATGPDLVHKTELGAVRLGLRGAAEVRAAAEEMTARLRADGHPAAVLVVQPMAPPGVEMIAGILHDRDFGPVVACGAGGTIVELLKDVSIRLAPLTHQDAAQMVRELKSYPLLTGYRGRPVVDVPALEQVLLRVSALVDELPQIAELDLNPVIVHPGGAVVVDARLRIAPFEAAPLLARNR